MSAASTKKVSKKTVTKKKTKKKVAIKKTAVKKSATKKPTTGKKTAKKTVVGGFDVTPEERWKMIAVAAYHKAEKRGFAAGHELDDWMEAEKDIDKLLYGG